MPVQSIQEINSLARPLFEQYNITYAAVFGSFASGHMEKNSDIDILVSFDGKYDLLDIIGLKQDLEELLGRKVDLLTLNSLKNDEFGNIVKSEAKKIYEKS
jgi:predicted nucleotidyltransferase